MIANDGKTPILMDFGSTMKARIYIENRSQALMQQVWTHILSFYRSFLVLIRVSLTGHCCGAKYDVLSRTRIVRRQNGSNVG